MDIGKYEFPHNQGKNLVEMPYRLGRDGRRREIVSMISTDTRNMLEEKIFAEYEKITGESLTRRKLP